MASWRRPPARDKMRGMRALAASVLLLLLAPRPAHADDPWLGSDKALHFGVSLALARGSYLTASLALDAPRDRALVATGIALGAGVGKELYDLTGRGDPSFKDLAWDAAGTAIGVGLSLLLDWALNDRQSTLHALQLGLRGPAR